MLFALVHHLLRRVIPLIACSFNDQMSEEERWSFPIS